MNALNENEQDRIEKKMNPWFTMWVYPRKTTRYVIENSKMTSVILLAMLSGVGSALNTASNRDLGEITSTSTIIFISFIFGPLLGLLGWFIFSFISYIVGKWFGGSGSMKELQKAIAWAYVPLVWSLLFWIPELAIMGDAMFQSVEVDIGVGQAIILLILALLELTICIWYIVSNIKAISEAHRFSAWKGLLTVLLPSSIIVFVLIIILLLLIAL